MKTKLRSMSLFSLRIVITQATQLTASNNQQVVFVQSYRQTRMFTLSGERTLTFLMTNRVINR